MQMTAGEIKRSYEEAKNKGRQVRILAELNNCSQDEIHTILSGEDKRKQLAIKADQKAMSIDDTVNILFARLDELEEQIKPLEEEYRNVKIAIDVIQKVRAKDGQSVSNE